MLKKLSCLILVFILLTAISACGGGSNSLVGRWQLEGRTETLEFFSDGTVIMGN